MGVRFQTFWKTRTTSTHSISARIDSRTRRQSSPVLQSLASVLNAALTTSRQSFPATLALLESNSGVLPHRNNENTASLRLDHSASRSNQLFARLSFSDADATGGGIGGLKACSWNQLRIQDYAAARRPFFGPKLVNEFRFQFANRDYNALPADSGPEITINGIAALGRDFFSRRDETKAVAVAGQCDGRFQQTSGEFADVHYLPSTQVRKCFSAGPSSAKAFHTCVGQSCRTGPALPSRSDWLELPL